MGLAPSSEVGPMFLLEDASAIGFLAAVEAGSAPRAGVSITGERTDFTMDDIERALGPRRTDFYASQKTFRHAWILLTQRGAPATAVEIAGLEDARKCLS